MMCIQPSWISNPSADSLPCGNTSILSSSPASDAGINSLDHVVNDVESFVHFLHLQNSKVSCCERELKTKASTTVSPYSKDELSRNRASKHKGSCKSIFGNAAKKQYKIKTLMKWIQRKGKKTNSKSKPVQNVQKKQETKTKPKTLIELMRVEENAKSFRRFLTKEMSEENLDFWVEVESYKKQDPTKREMSAQCIFNTYIAPGAPKEINIDSYVRRLTRESLQSPQSTTFDLAQEKIFKLMETDSFRRFLKTL